MCVITLLTLLHNPTNQNLALLVGGVVTGNLDPVPISADRDPHLRPNQVPIPKKWQDVQSSVFKDQWIEALDREAQSFEIMEVFQEIQADDPGLAAYLKEGHRILDSMIAWSVKNCAEGIVTAFKARVCARGDRRKVGIHHLSAEVYANILMIKTLRTTLATALQDTSTIATRHWDVKCAFLAGRLKKKIYMRLPPGFPGVKSKLVLLFGAVYGLPEALRVFTEKLTTKLLSIGFVQSPHDRQVYILRRKEYWIIIPAFVDDMYPTHNNDALALEVYKELSKEFIMKDEGPLEFSLLLTLTIRLAPSLCTSHS